MVKLEWICDKCKTVWVIGYEGNDPLTINEVIKLECDECGSEFALVMNKK